MKILLITMTALIFSACGNSQSKEQYFIKRNFPTEVNTNPKIINKLITDIKNEKIQNIHSILILKDDYLITEEYFGGQKKSDIHYTASISKSFASTLLGIAIDEGFFKGDIETVLNKKVSELFPEYKNLISKDSLKNNLKLKHMLTMTAGFEWDEHTFPYSDSRNDCIRINNSEEPMKFLFERKLIHKPGTEFYYNGGLSLAISYLIEKYTKIPVDKFAEKYLFKPLNIDEYQWEKLPNGLIDTDGGLHLKPIDQAKLGYLFLNKGSWKGDQIVTKEWVKVSATMHKKNNGMPDYGYQWWGGNYGVFNQTFEMFLASGHGGQKIVVIPKLNAVIVIAQQVFNNPYGHINFISIMSDYVLPALTNEVHKNDAIPTSNDNLKHFEGHFQLTNNNTEFIDFSVDNRSLIGLSSDGQKNVFVRISENVFKTRVMDLIDIHIEFIEDDEGNIESITSDFAFQHKKYTKTSNSQ